MLPHAVHTRRMPQILSLTRVEARVVQLWTIVERCGKTERAPQWLAVDRVGSVVLVEAGGIAGDLAGDVVGAVGPV